MNYWFLYLTVNGSIYEQPYYGSAIEWTNIPSGCAVLGPLDEKDMTVQDAWRNPSHYEVQGNVLVKIITNTELFAETQQVQLSVLSQGLKATLIGGFSAKTLVGSATTPHKYPTDAGAQANFTGAITAFTANPNKTSVTVLTLDAGWVPHTKAEFFGVYADGDNWKESQYPQLSTLQAKVNAMKLSDYSTLADGIAAIQGVTWTEATY